MNTKHKPRWGVLGGTFDPPHVGHLILAEEALYQLNLESIHWLLTPDPPHKTERQISPVNHRVEMLRLALSGENRFCLSYLDINRPSPHYAADTMRLLRAQNSHIYWVYLMGGDSLADLPTWERPLEFLQACDEIGVMLRPGRTIDLEALNSELPGLKDKVRLLQAPLLEISSTTLRKNIAEGIAYRYYLLPSVYNYVENHSLYQQLIG